MDVKIIIATVSNVNDQSSSAEANSNQSTTRLTHDQFADHTSNEALTTKRPFLRVSNQVVKEQRQSEPTAGRSDAGRDSAEVTSECQATETRN